MYEKENTMRPLKNAGLSQRAQPGHRDASGRWDMVKQHLDASIMGDMVKQVLHKSHSAAFQNHVYRTDVIVNHQPQQFIYISWCVSTYVSFCLFVCFCVFFFQILCPACLLKRFAHSKDIGKSQTKTEICL